jgi:hypothetical protein
VLIEIITFVEVRDRHFKLVGLNMISHNGRNSTITNEENLVK